MSTKLKTVRSVFVHCQESVHCPPKMVKQLKKIYASVSGYNFNTVIDLIVSF